MGCTPFWSSGSSSKHTWFLAEFISLKLWYWGPCFLVECQLDIWLLGIPNFLLSGLLTGPFLHHGRLHLQSSQENFLLQTANHKNHHLITLAIQCNQIKRMTRHHFCHILVARSKSQVLSTLKGRKLYKGATDFGLS